MKAIPPAVLLIVLAFILLVPRGAVVSQKDSIPSFSPVASTETPVPSVTPLIMTMTPKPTQTTAPVSIPTFSGIRIDQPVDAYKGMTLGVPGAVECWNCAPFSPSLNGETVKVKLSNYEPWRGGDNCWLWSEDFRYCMSETRSGVYWEPIYGLSAACPEGWEFTTWVAIPQLGFAVMCFDTGGAVVCHEGSEEEIAAGEPAHCHVDILGPGGEWNQKLFDAVLWVSLNPR